MARPTKFISETNAQFGMPPLRQYWQQINRHDREIDSQKRARRKQTDKTRPKCRCEAYPWPHRPSGGLCRSPDAPIACYLPSKRRREYCDRYIGIRKKIARASGLHPIRDKALIAELIPGIMRSAKALKQNAPRVKFRNMFIKERQGNRITLSGEWQTAGPLM